MMLRPVRDLVFIRPLPQPSMVGGLLVPDVAPPPPFAGIVRAVGPAVTDLRPRDVVIFGLWAGQEHLLNDEPCLVMRETDVVAVLT